MSKTPEEMFYEWRQAFHENLRERLTEGEPIEDLSKEIFLAGYKAAKDEEVAKDQKIAELWTESIKNMLPSVHEITLFPSKLKEDK
jgi:hypothetical protein